MERIRNKENPINSIKRKNLLLFFFSPLIISFSVYKCLIKLNKVCCFNTKCLSITSPSSSSLFQEHPTTEWNKLSEFLYLSYSEHVIYNSLLYSVEKG